MTHDQNRGLDPTSGKPLATDEEINMTLEKLAVHNQSELEQKIKNALIDYGYALTVSGGELQPIIDGLADYITANYTPKKHLVELLNLFGTPTCESLHHPKKYQHRAVDDCPVVGRIAELKAQQEEV